MKKHKKQMYLLYSIILLMVTLSLSFIIMSCGDDLDSYPYQTPTLTNTSTISSTSNTIDTISSAQDFTPPDEVENLKISPDDSKLTISWNNPDTDDFKGILILKKEGSFPSSRTDSSATVVCTNCSSPVEETGLTNGKIYYYTVYSYDVNGNYSGGENVAMAPRKKLTQLTFDNGKAFAPKVAYTTNKYGVVWQDQRHGDWEIFFNIITSATGVKDYTKDIRITSNTSKSIDPQIVRTTTDYTLVWVDDRDGHDEIYFCKVNDSGVKTASEVRVTNSDNPKTQPDIAYNGTVYGLVWKEIVEGTEHIFYASLDANGTISGDTIQITESVGNINQNPAICLRGTNFGVAWEYLNAKHWDIYFVEITGTTLGTIKNLTDTTTGNDSITPDISTDGTNYAVTWTDNRHGHYEIYYAQVDTTPAVLAEKRVTNNSASSILPAITWDMGTNNNFAVTWTDNRDGDWDIYIKYLQQNGTIDSNETTIPNVSNDSKLSYSSSVAWDSAGSLFGVVFQTDQIDNPYIEMERLNNSGTPPVTPVAQGKTSLTVSIGDSIRPLIEYDGTDLNIFWNDNRNGNWDIYFNKINSSGVIQLTNDKQVYNDADQQRNVDLVKKSSTEFGLVWQENNGGGGNNEEVFFSRVDNTGTIVGAAKELTTDTIFADTNFNYSVQPSICWSGSKYAMAWISDHSVIHDGKAEIYFAKADGTTGNTEVGLRVTDNDYSPDKPSIAYGSSGYGIVWTEDGDDDDKNPEIYFALIDDAGTKVGTEAKLAIQSERPKYPQIIWNSTASQFLIVYIVQSEDENKIYTQKLSPTGALVGSEMEIYAGKLELDISKPIWNSTTNLYTISWHEIDDFINDIYYIQWDTDGKVLSNEIRISFDSDNISAYPSVTQYGSNSAFVWQDNRYGKFEIFMNY